MKKIVFTSLMTAAFILTGANGGRSQNASEPKNGFQQPDLILKDSAGKPNSNTLNADRCKSDFVTCAKIAESANLLNITYRNNNSSDNNALEIAKNSLTASGAGWDRGYKREDINIISAEWKPDGIPLVDAQAILAKKEIQETKNGSKKKQFMISVRGTEQPQDWLTNLASLNLRDYENGTKAGNGFINYAKVIADDTNFTKMVDEIIKSEKNQEKYEVLIAGHSLGGAAAVILKAEIENRMDREGIPNAKQKVSAITFGAPPIGDEEFAKEYGKRVTGINISGDPVSGWGTKILKKLSWKANKVGTIYEFQRPSDVAKIFDKVKDRLANLSPKELFNNSFFKGVRGDIVSTISGIDSHKNGYSEQERYESARNSSKGAQNTAPFVFLYRDVIPKNGGTGDEQTRIQVLQNGVYRFYVHDYTNKDSTNSTALSNSEAKVNVYSHLAPVRINL